MEEKQDRASQFSSAEYLIQISQDLSLARSLKEITAIVRKAARKICGADGATFVLREGDLCYYVDEDAIEPLWKGRKFPIQECVSGWSILHGESLVIEDIYSDQRVLHDAYRPTFVKSLVMVPIREKNPLGAIGNYWANYYKAPDECIILLRSLANLAAIALENIQLVERFKKANRFLENLVNVRDEFISIASHELRTPLCSLKLQLQMLAREIQLKVNHVPDPKRLKNAVDLSLRQVGNLASLVENLLDASRVQFQNLQLNASNFDFSSVVREVVEQFMPQMTALKSQVDLDLQDGIIGRWDKSRLSQIVANLVSNACKYAAGTPIKISTRKQYGLVILTVEDKGPGIRKENQKRIFERFEREMDNHHVNGLGLGLFITKSLVEAHSGRIILESDEGKGAKFILEFPC